MAWISVHEQVVGMKLRELSKSIGCSQKEALGILVSLWLWGINNADRDGLLRGADKNDIVDALSTGLSTGLSTKNVVECLLEYHWIDIKESKFYLHDWDFWQEQWYKALGRRNYDAGRKRKERMKLCPQDSPPESPVQPSPSPSPINKEREIDENAISQVDIDKALRMINDKSFEFSMNGVSPEFREDAETRLKEGTDIELIIKALSMGATNSDGKGPAKCKYAISVLQRWTREGIKTIEQWTDKNALKSNSRDRPAGRGDSNAGYKKRDAGNGGQQIDGIGIKL